MPGPSTCTRPASHHPGAPAQVALAPRRGDLGAAGGEPASAHRTAAQRRAQRRGAAHRVGAERGAASSWAARCVDAAVASRHASRQRPAVGTPTTRDASTTDCSTARCRRPRSAAGMPTASARIERPAASTSGELGVDDLGADRPPGHGSRSRRLDAGPCVGVAPPGGRAPPRRAILRERASAALHPCERSPAGRGSGTRPGCGRRPGRASGSCRPCGSDRRWAQRRRASRRGAPSAAVGADGEHPVSTPSRSPVRSVGRTVGGDGHRAVRRRSSPRVACSQVARSPGASSTVAVGTPVVQRPARVPRRRARRGCACGCTTGRSSGSTPAQRARPAEGEQRTASPSVPRWRRPARSCVRSSERRTC